MAKSRYAGGELEHITTQMSVQSFGAVCNTKTHTLILGSMPGVASLNAIEYYAHKRNAFWPILLAMMDDVEPSFDSPSQHTYQERLTRLTEHGFGLWDVLAQCERKGSLDSAIVSDSIVANDIAGLLQQFPKIKNIAFNGKTSQRLFDKHVRPTLTEPNAKAVEINWISLPSSSPAMASLTLNAKFEQWRSALQ